MAKSFFEPKKIVRYANNQQVIEGGLAGQSTPPRQVSATRAVPKTQAIPAGAQKIAAANVPSPAPPFVDPSPTPPVPEVETRSFLFDGATESLQAGITQAEIRLMRTCCMAHTPLDGLNQILEAT